ncbi:MAG: hypothetical protein ACJ75G_08680 [Gaiellaceae bacterium]
MKRPLRAPSPASIISLIALFVALGGTSYAAITTLPKNSVGTKQLVNGAVTKKKIDRKTLGQLKGAPGARGPSDVYEMQLDASSPQAAAGASLTLALPNLPPGAYAIYGKAAIDPTQTNASSSKCTLTADRDSDIAFNPVRTDAKWVTTISTELTHTFASTGTVTMTCVVFSDKWILGSSATGGDTRIIAVAAAAQHKATAATATS